MDVMSGLGLLHKNAMRKDGLCARVPVPLCMCAGLRTSIRPTARRAIASMTQAWQPSMLAREAISSACCCKICPFGVVYIYYI